MARPLALARLLVVLPSWVGDAVMATPMLRALRRGARGVEITGLCRPGIGEVLAGTDYFDRVFMERTKGVGEILAAALRLRRERFDACLLLPNSFSCALVARLSGIPRRIGYDRDGRGMLLTDRLRPLRRRDAEPFSRSTFAPDDWAPVSAVSYYFALAAFLLKMLGKEPGPAGPLELAVTQEGDAAARKILRQTGLLGESGEAPPPLAMLCPGGNREEKRWPPGRFAAIAEHLVAQHGATVLVSGSPGEAALTAAVRGLVSAQARGRVVDLVAASNEQMSIGTLKGLVKRCRVVVTNDTGPRHIAAALEVPVVALFGPTDPRWAAIPFEEERVVAADPTLPPEEVANDHPDRCRIDRIGVEEVIAAVDALLP